MSDRIYLAESQPPSNGHGPAVPVVSAKIAQLSKNRCAVFFDNPEDGITSKARLTVTVGGKAQSAPLMILRLPLASSGLRFIALLRTGEAPIHHQEIKIDAGDRLVARIDPDALQSPCVNHLSLLSGLTSEGQSKLLRALLTTGPSLFKQGRDADKSLDGFDKIIQQLLSSLSVPLVPLDKVHALGTSACCLSYTLPKSIAPVEISDLVEVADGRTVRLPKFHMLVQSDGDSLTLHLVLERPLAPGATLIGIAGRPLHLAGPALQDDLRPLQSWLERQTPAVQRFVTNVLKSLCPHDPVAQDLYEELRCPDEDRPDLEILYAARCGDGLLYMLKAHDPRSLLSKARWVSGDVEIDVSLDGPVWHPTYGDIYPGYVRGFEQAGLLQDQFELWGEMRSRRAFLVETKTPAAFDGRIPDIYQPLSNPMVDRMLGRAVACAVQDRPLPKATLDRFGPQAASFKTSVLVFVDDNFDHPRALVTQLAREAGAEATLVTLVAAHFDQRPTLRHLAELLNAITPCTVVVLSFNAQALPSEKLRVGLAQNSAEVTILFLGACLPQTAGWLGRWHALVSNTADAQTASVFVQPEGFSHSSRGRCQILNYTAVEAFKRKPLRAASVEADLAELGTIALIESPQSDAALCYDTGLGMSSIQNRADTEAIAYLGQSTP